LQASGSTGEGTREKELAKRLSSVFLEWEKQPSTPVPRGLERIKTEIDVPAALRVENVIVAAGQRDQQELAAIHLESGRRLSQAERDAEAISELRRAIYLAPYQHDAHLLLGEIYLRAGRVEEAVDELKISVWSQETVAARLRLAEAYIAAGNPDLARTELQTVLMREPANSRARQLLTQLP
jgi:Tfp pilus assembly protein PilF